MKTDRQAALELQRLYEEMQAGNPVPGTNKPMPRTHRNGFARAVLRIMLAAVCIVAIVRCAKTFL